MLKDWNSLIGEDSLAVLLTVIWERDTTPEMGERPQSVINHPAID